MMSLDRCWLFIAFSLSGIGNQNVRLVLQCVNLVQYTIVALSSAIQATRIAGKIVKCFTACSRHGGSREVAPALLPVPTPASVHGSTKNNLMTFPVLSVLVDPVAPASQRYKLVLLTTIERQQDDEFRARHPDRWEPRADRGDHIYAIRGATFPDGIEWTWNPQLLSIEQSDTQIIGTYDQRLEKYVLYTIWEAPPCPAAVSEIAFLSKATTRTRLSDGKTGRSWVKWISPSGSDFNWTRPASTGWSSPMALSRLRSAEVG
jgi:hypothetical protein